MSIRFIHTADWQIGKPFRNFPDGLAGELAAARLDGIGRIASIARAEGAGHVLVAGDVFDSDRLDNILVRRALERLAAECDLVWLLLPGNHDPARATGIWDRIRHIGTPANVVALETPRPHALSPEAIVLPAPLTSKNPGRDPTDWMASAETAPGIVRIGLAHGSVRGFDSEGESAAQIAPDRATSAGLAYLALGDWHGAKAIDAKTWYSGTPEPDKYPDNEPGFVLAVTLEGAAPRRIERIKSATFQWAKVTAQIRTPEDLGTVGNKISALTDQPDRLLVRLALTGSLSLAGFGTLDTWREVWSGKLRHLDLDTEKLIAQPEEGDISSLGGSGPLVEAARSLEAIANNRNHPDHISAALALVRLFAFANEAREAEG